MRTNLHVILLLVLLFVPLATTSQTGVSTGGSPAQDAGLSLNTQRVYAEDHALDMYSAISASGYRDYVQEFTENGSRWILDASMALEGNNMKARNYLLSKLNELSNGRIETEVFGDHLNVIGKLPGYLPGNNPAIVLVGHYDSWYISIGANEGGSGIATILELIEPLSAYQWPLDIYFIALNGRYAQWGPFGGDEVSSYFLNNEVDILAMYCVEALLYRDPTALPDEQVFMAYLHLGQADYHRSQYWADLGRAMSNNYGQNRIKSIPHYDLSAWSSSWYEHNSFIDRGYQNVIVPFESGFLQDDAYRTPDDTWLNPNYQYQLGREVAGAIGASIAYTMSREYGMPIHHDFNIEIGYFGSKTFYIPITTPTLVNVSSRWFGGIASFTLLDPNLNIVAFQEYNTSSAWEPTDVFSEQVTQKGIYSLVIENPGVSRIGMSLHYSHNSDINGNGVLDKDEYWLDTALFQQDSDEDTISDAYEIIYGTDLNNPDSDSDTMPDNYEFEQGFDPLDPSDGASDADGDSLTNAEEYSLGLNPWKTDTDSDKIPDAWEVANGLDPLVDDALGDPDEDGKTNLDEFLDGTNPLVAESDALIIPWFVPPSIIVISFAVFIGWLFYRESRFMD